MTLLISAFAAIISTIVWYISPKRDVYRLGFLSLMFWGATIMWTCDAVAEYLQLGAEYFYPAGEDMLNDAFLGICVVALGLFIWLVQLIIKDPQGIVKKAVLKSK